MMRGFWRTRQRSVGCISPHAWKLPLVMALCILVYSLPLSLAVSVEPPSGARSSTDDSPLNQLVAPPRNRNTFDVTYLGALTDKWLGWTPLQNVCNKPSKQPSFGDKHVPLHGGRLFPPVVPVFKFIVLLLLLLLAGDIESNPGPVTVLTPHDVDTLFCCLCPFAASWKEIGQELGVHLEVERTVPISEPVALLHQLLCAWLRSSEASSDQGSKQPTLENLCSALRSPSVMGGEVVASDLEQHWNQEVECQVLLEDLEEHKLHEVQVLDIIPLDVSPCVLKKATYKGKECLIISYHPIKIEEVNRSLYSEYLKTCFRVKHENVVRIYGVHCLPDSPYPAVVFEELEPLSNFAKGRDISEKQQICILLDIARALSAFTAVPSVQVKAVGNAVFVSTSPEDLTAKFLPMFGCSYCLVATDTLSSNVQCLHEITMFLNSQGQTIEGNLPVKHILEPAFRDWFQKSSPLGAVTERLKNLFREESRRVATLEEFKDLVEITHLHVILIGHTGGGKTSVVRHLKGEKLNPDENSTEVMKSQLLVCKPKHLEGTHAGFFLQESDFYKAESGKFYLNIWDTGGQTMFQDLLPCFAKLRSLYGIVFKLTDDLDSYPESSFRFGRQKYSTGPSPYSNKELIYRCLGYIEMFSSSIQDTIPRLPSEIVNIWELQHREQVFPKAVLIGTHADHFNMSEDEERLKALVAFTDSLVQVESLCSKTHFPTESPFQVAVYMVDNTKAGGDDIDKGIKILVEDIGTLAKQTTVKVPKKWLYFKQRLEEVSKSKYPNGIVPFIEVCKVAEECCISAHDVDAPLIYFHELGFFLWYYYSNRPILKDYVVLYPEKLLKALARIFDAKGYGPFPCEWTKLRYKGILKKKLSDYCLDEQKTGIRTQWVLDFLTEHYVISPIDHKVLGEGYFVPSMLPLCVELDQLAEPTSSLYIVFKVGFVPPGLFPKWVTILSDQSLKLGGKCWVLCEPLYRNQVKFEAEQNYRVLLTEHVDCIQVECCPPPLKSPDPLVYRTVRNVLDVCLFRTVPKWIYEREYCFTFACTEASRHFLSELPPDPTTDWYVTCSQHHTTRLTEGQLLWLGIGKIFQLPNIDLTLELPELLADLYVVAAKWYNIGLNLVPHVTRGNLNNIRASCRDEPCDCLREMLSCWLNKVHPKPRWESVVAALRCPVVDEEQLAQTLEQKYCTVASTPSGLQHLGWRLDTEIPSLSDLYEELFPIMPLQDLFKLKHILGMDFPEVETDSVHTFSRGSEIRTFTETMHLWLKRSPQPTWEVLFKALTKMGHHQLAENIKARLRSSKRL